MGLIGFELTCLTCNLLFFICKGHYRGQCYCSEGCRKEGYKKKHNQARRKYDQKPEAKRSNAKRQKSNIIFSTLDKIIGVQKKVTYQSYIFNNNGLNLFSRDSAQTMESGRCCVCGREISILVRIDEKNGGNQGRKSGDYE